jgi:hypothetical protein
MSELPSFALRWLCLVLCVWRLAEGMPGRFTRALGLFPLNFSHPERSIPQAALYKRCGGRFVGSLLARSLAGANRGDSWELEAPKTAIASEEPLRACNLQAQA